MAWSVIRKATNEDYEKLDLAAGRFIERHNIDTRFGNGNVYVVEEQLANMTSIGQREDIEIEGKRLRRLWLACVRRALGHKWAEGIAHGTVGFEVR